MDMRELLEPVYPDEEPRKAWPLVLGGVAIVSVLAVGSVILFGAPDEVASGAGPAAVSTSIAEDGVIVEGSEPAGTTVTTTTLDPSATTPEQAIAAAEEYIAIEDDSEAIEAFFSEVDRFIYFITVLRNPEEIARYMQRHAPNTDNFEIVNDPITTADGTVILEVDYTYNGNLAQVTWEIAVTEGKVTLFAADGR